jgi:hypothetical protein
MIKVKCGQCGLVNSDSVSVCLRCKASLDGTGHYEPVRRDSEITVAGGFGFAKFGAILAAIAIVGFGAYLFMAPVTPSPKAAQVSQPTNAQPAAPPVMTDQQRVLQAMQDDARKITERSNQQINAAVNAMKKGFNDPEMRRLMDNSVKKSIPKPDHLPNPYQKPL